jgi:hypothetical protein
MHALAQPNIRDAEEAPCPKCGTMMQLAAVTPHPIAVQMERHTFLCTKCNQTKTYMLPRKEAPGPEAAPQGPPVPQT